MTSTEQNNEIADRYSKAAQLQKQSQASNSSIADRYAQVAAVQKQQQQNPIANRSSPSKKS